MTNTHIYIYIFQGLRYSRHYYWTNFFKFFPLGSSIKYICSKGGGGGGRGVIKSKHGRTGGGISTKIGSFALLKKTYPLCAPIKAYPFCPPIRAYPHCAPIRAYHLCAPIRSYPHCATIRAYPHGASIRA